MAEAYIVDALRSPTGKRRGRLASIHGSDLGAHVLKTLVQRNAIPAEDYDDVMWGCLDTIGPLSGDIARTCWLAAGLPQNVPRGHHRPPMRFVPAGRPLCGASSDVRDCRCGCRGRRADNEPDPHFLVHDLRKGTRVHRSVLWFKRLDCALR